MNDMSQFPGILQEIADAAGEEAAMLVAREKGGTRVRFPIKPRDGHWTVQLLGRPRAEAIGRALNGNQSMMEYDIPLGPGSTYSQQRRARQQAMQKAIEEGLTYNAAARAAGVDRSSFRRFNKRVREAKRSRQGTLL